METFYCITVSALMAALVALSGCSFGIEWQYHGQTGIDNRTQTQLVKDSEAEKKKRDY
jgi:hypothetical protein